MSDDPLSSRDPEASRPREGGRRTVLVVTNEELAGRAVDAVASEVRGAGANGDPEVRVVSPALATSALKHQVNDIDEAVGPARERLETSLRALRDAGLAASGEVGDADPLLAIKDELLKNDIERILLVTHDRDEESAYAEKELLERVGREVEPPATELRVAGHDRDEEVVGRRRAGAGTERGEEGRRISPNLPPLWTMDMAGLAVAILGTIVLILLAGSCSDQQHEQGDGLGTEAGNCGLAYLLAGGFFLVNLGHVGALLLMSSVNYRGPFQRFFARTSIYGTPLAIVASALIVTL